MHILYLLNVNMKKENCKFDLNKLFIFISENPSLYITIGNSIVPQNYSITNLVAGNIYQISCVAINSRPSVSLSISANNVDLTTFSRVSIIQSFSQCDSNMYCTTYLVLNLMLSDPRLIMANTIKCTASNISNPFNIQY